jgi:hypothetical protein
MQREEDYKHRALASDAAFHKTKRSHRARPLLPANDYFASCVSTSGSTAVPSALTASNAAGFSPSAFRIVGATCVVAVSAETVCAVKLDKLPAA